MIIYARRLNKVVTICGRSLMDRTKASDAFNAGSIPVGRSLHQIYYSGKCFYEEFR